MKKWSGLAPAVDAHLSRWAVMKRVAELTQYPSNLPLPGSDYQEKKWSRETLRKVGQTDAGYRWLSFARSYGLPGPDPNGPALPSYAIGDVEGTIFTQDECTVSGRERFDHTSQSLVTGVLLIQREYRMLDAAVTHYVSAEVIDEVTQAAEEAFPEPLFDTDLFTPAGFAVFEKPVRMIDLHPETGLPDHNVHTYVRAMGWHRHGGILNTTDGKVGEGVTLFIYTTPDDHLNGYIREASEAYGADPDRELIARDEDIEGPFLPLEVIPWRFGVEWDVRPEDANFHIPGSVPTPVANQRRWFFAFMRLCWQEIIVRHTEHEPRHTHRRWERLAQRKELLDYTTLRLRRVVDPFYVPTGMGLPLDHRVKVRAHWRRVYVPSIGGPARLPDGSMNPVNHRAVWIEEHWRGPEDGPIGPMHSGTSVIR